MEKRISEIPERKFSVVLFIYQSFCCSTVYSIFTIQFTLRLSYTFEWNKL